MPQWGMFTGALKIEPAVEGNAWKVHAREDEEQIVEAVNEKSGGEHCNA